MRIAGQDFKFVDTYSTPISVADSWVKAKNKTGAGNGEAKLYIGRKDRMRKFFNDGDAGFNVRCFLLKSDLMAYMHAIKSEYIAPSQEYRGKDDMPQLWEERIGKIEDLPEIIGFDVQDQVQIEEGRGYVNSDDPAYALIREIALPYVSYISTMHLKENGSDIFYWRLFADFAEMEKRKEYVTNYGKKSIRATSSSRNPSSEDGLPLQKEYRYAREGQGKYRERLLEECPFCPITMINEESLLIASHIKPWAVSEDREKTDPKNGFILSPLYDKLFDRGFITFTDDRRVAISNWLSRQDRRRIGIGQDQLFQFLPIDAQRIKYLEYHRAFVYKG